MRTVHLEAEDDFDGWRDAARALVTERVPAEQVVWQVGERPTDLFSGERIAATHARPFGVPRQFVSLARQAIRHSTPERFALLYALLLRVLENPHRLGDRADPRIHRIERLAHAVGHDIHKMQAFVRFRKVSDGDRERFVAWFEPEHHILRANARFFIKRFTNMRWSILTPRGSMHWDGESLSEGPPSQRRDAPHDDQVETVWKAYYAAIFNPARLMKKAMMKEMPRKYWQNMPETALIPALIAGAYEREQRMIEQARLTLPVFSPEQAPDERENGRRAQ